MTSLSLPRLRFYFAQAQARIRNTLFDDDLPSYEPIPTASFAEDKRRSPEDRPDARFNGRRRGWILPKLSVLLGLLGTLVLLVVLLAADLKKQPAPHTSLTTTKSVNIRLVIPTNIITDGVCKSLLSATLLGYPAPTLINYNQTFDSPFVWAGGSHLAKISGILEYLNKFGPEHDDDLVVITDALDVWYQLRPSVLVERWLELNRKANDRIRQQLGRGAEVEGIKQTVIFTSQKKCWPGAVSDPSCWAVPESWMPTNLYGPDTDKEFPSWPNPYHNFRHRWLNSGSTIGPLADVRAIFQRSNEYVPMKDHFYFGRDQGLFADVFGEQEVYRRRVAAKWHGTVSDELYPFNLTEGKNYEFSIGVDYQNALVMSTVFSSNDTEYIKHSDQDNIAHVSAEMGIANPHIGLLPEDIDRSKRPFANMAASDSTLAPLLSNTGWEDVPLFTDMWLGSTPVMIHHNAWRDNAKERIETTWNQAWFQPYAKSLYEVAYAGRKNEPLAEVNIAGQVHQWWPGDAQPGVITTDAGYDLKFDDICSEYHDVLFADQKEGLDEQS